MQSDDRYEDSADYQDRGRANNRQEREKDRSGRWAGHATSYQALARLYD
jgi:hypothetical protein